jgi:hypothetical protein
MSRFLRPLSVLALVATSLILGSAGAASASTNPGHCSKLTLAVVKGDGFTKATPAMTTPYNYTKASANAANALGTTIDFGAKALVISCVSPADIAKLSVQAQGSMKPTMTAQQYMNYLVKQSAGAMKKTMVGGVADYLDYGNGKEDGLGSTAAAASVRLDAWVAGKYIVLTQTEPAGPPSAALLKFIASTKSLL